jgi:hypothetical protein
MAMYLCRWPNGDFSVVNARTKGDAIEMLDELGNAEQATLTRMTDCMFDFRLSDEGRIEVADISDATEEFIMESCYPELQRALSAAESEDAENPIKYQEQVRGAVERERTRLWENQPPPKTPETQIGRDIQKQLGAAGVLVNRIVSEVGDKRMKSKEGEGKKPN